MCNCINDIEERFKTKLEAEGVSLSKPPKIRESVYPFDDGYLVSKITTSNLNWSENVTKKTGATSVKNKSIGVFHKYCPFCGESYIKPEID